MIRYLAIWVYRKPKAMRCCSRYANTTDRTAEAIDPFDQNHPSPSQHQDLSVFKEGIEIESAARMELPPTPCASI